MRVKQIAWPDGSMVRLFLGGTVDKRAGSSQEDAESWNSEMSQQCRSAGRYGHKGETGRRGSKQSASSTRQAREVNITVAFIVRRWGWGSRDCNGCALPKADWM